MSDWWPGSSTQSTPLRSNQPFTPQPKPRFAGDELDPQDAAMAENVKFYPTFGSTPAGKAFQGGASGNGSVGSPGATTGGAGMSPGGARRSPQHRFSLGGSPNDAMSPRNRLTGRTPFPNVGSPPDDDLPPTLSLRDNPSSPAPLAQSSTPVPSSSSSGAHTPLPPPPNLQPTSDTTSLYVFGPPPDQLPHLLPWLSECGQVESYHPAIDGGWYYQVTYTSPIGASYALRRHGDVVGGKYMVGFKIVQPGQTVAPPGGTNVPGGRLVVKDQGNVMKSKPAGPSSTVGAVVKKDGYAWDDNEPTSGVINRAAEWLFGR